MDLEPKYLALLSEAERQQLSDLDSLQLCFQALSLSALIDRESAFMLAPHDLSEGRFVLLALLEPHKEGLPPHVLADQAGVARATITGLVDGMVRDGMVERHGNPLDRRSNLVRITRKGRQLTRKVFAQQSRWYAGLFAVLSVNERRQLGKTLAKLSADIRARSVQD
ncbi:MAG: MarR family transcriptional regulator [Lautropia sp.]|nr:MarR family transcriptional regulator [Lautropia sp.]